MSPRRSLVSVVLALVALPALGDQPSAAPPDLIPLPERLTVTEGSFTVGAKTTIWATKSEQDVASMLAEAISRGCGIRPRVRRGSPPAGLSDAVSLVVDPELGPLGDEGYTLSVTPNHIRIAALTNAGLFYGVQTLRQLLPVAPPKGRSLCAVGCLEIEDVPRFGWRGFMLDCSRHFVKKRTVLALLDALAQFKINRFHWHLADDNAWRLAIRKYPELVKPAPINAGWYTQSAGYYSERDVREVVAAAKRLHIVVIPEIEMPSHETQAASVLPDACCLGPDGKPLPPGSTREFCLGSDKAITELQDILLETMALFPDSPYIHIGGDEAQDIHWRACPRCQARMAELGITDPRLLQKWFMNTINAFVHDHGRTSMAWADRLSLGIPPGQLVHGWHGGEVEEAVSKGFQAVQSDAAYTYFDYAQGPGDTMYGGPSLTLDQVYALDPVRGLPPDQAALVLGPQAQLWTELVPDELVFSKTFPRILALAEVAWSPQDRRDFGDFSKRLDEFLPRLDAEGIPYYRAAATAGKWSPKDVSESWTWIEWDVTALVHKPGPIQFEFSFESGAHGLAIDSALLLEDGREIARDAHAGWAGAGTHDNVYRLTVPEPLGDHAHFVLRAHIRSDGGTDSHGSVLVR
jgi:hexosaminidase